MTETPEAPERDPAERATLQEHVYRKLREALISGCYEPGHVLQVRALAEQFGVSTMPVREAQMRLVAERALQVLPNRAIRVPILDDAETEELYALRMLLETRAGRQAAERFDPAALAALEALQSEMDAAMERPGIDEALHLNAHFHFAIYRAGTTSVSLSVIESLWMMSGPIIRAPLRRGAARLPGSMDKSARTNHRLMIDGLRRGDGDAVAQAIEADLAVALAAFRGCGWPAESDAS
ncbi:GntR family transcriptional regulator [Rhodosalinus halophilus]|uniref:GntR family transcriptional regulator n=1 Tax=Rhodosalinus halophilus TaxID=2259333 RepID=A0A365U4J5_9RHOB|nr:GntR family transcriptional regulator [Rhodosalinus halophilus]RBI83141.1 GntR family transcriptional regulator [Rhodosalinus halophilus]